MTQTELKLHTPKGVYTVIEIDGEYRLKKNRDIHVMINCNRNTRYITDDNAEIIQDKLLGANNNSLYHLVFYDDVKRRDLNNKPSLRKIEVIEVVE